MAVVQPATSSSRPRATRILWMSGKERELGKGRSVRVTLLLREAKLT
jgi:hypothetical protein